MTCPICQCRPVTKHFNSKYCLPCRELRRKRPAGNITPDQEALLLKLRGTMTREKLVTVAGVSRATIYRFGRDRGISFAREVYSDELKAEVVSYYEKHGGPATAKAFPGVRVRSIYERHEYEPRQTRWTDQEIIRAARMAGLVSMQEQAKIFARPNAYAGSIHALWNKRFRMGGSLIHGLAPYLADEILTPGYPLIRTQYWNTRRKNTSSSRRVALWCTMGPYLRPDLPRFMCDAIDTMADFQRWLFQSKRPERVIAKMLS